MFAVFHVEALESALMVMKPPLRLLLCLFQLLELAGQLLSELSQLAWGGF